MNVRVKQPQNEVAAVKYSSCFLPRKCKVVIFVCFCGIVLAILGLFSDPEPGIRGKVLRLIRHRKWWEHDIGRVRQLFWNQSQHLGLTPVEREVHRMLLKAFDDYARSRGMQYILYSGTLIGYHRNGDMTPWDDDLDLMANASFLEDIIQSFRNTNDFMAVRHSDTLIKVFSPHFATARYAKYPWSWPWLDVFTFETDGQHILQKKDNITYFKASDILPVKRVPFMGLHLPVPRDVPAVLNTLYKQDVRRVCKPNSYDHRREQYLEGMIEVEVDCGLLSDLFNFTRKKV